MSNFENYAVWYEEALKCAECVKCSCIVNGNIDPDKAQSDDGTHLILPQGGFVDLDWFEVPREDYYRILILGQNPHGGNLADRPEWH